MSAAKVKQPTGKIHFAKPKVKRPGIHAKTQTSVLKSSKNYTKQYRGQGR